MGLWPAKKEETPPATPPAETPPPDWKAEVDASKAEAVAAKTEAAALRTRLDDLEKRFPVTPPKETPSETPAEGDEAELSPAAKKLLEKELKPMRDGLTAQAAQMAESNFRMSHANDPVFTKFQGEFNELLGKQSLDARANPALIANCWNIVQANHIKEVYELVHAGQGNNGDGIGHGGGRPPGNTATTAKPEDSLTPVELAQAKRMHITPTQYAESKSKLTIVNG